MYPLLIFYGSLENEKFFYKDNPDRVEKGKYSLLPEKYKKAFRTKQIVRTRLATPYLYQLTGA